MKDEIKVNKANKSITFINNGIAFSQFGVADEILDLITNLQEENERLKELDENYPIEEQLAEALKYENIYKSRINKAIHRIQLLQMDNEVTVKDLGLIARDLTGGDE